jgi:hypothetical protein
MNKPLKILKGKEESINDDAIENATKMFKEVIKGSSMKDYVDNKYDGHISELWNRLRNGILEVKRDVRAEMDGELRDFIIQQVALTQDEINSKIDQADNALTRSLNLTNEQYKELSDAISDIRISSAKSISSIIDEVSNNHRLTEKSLNALPVIIENRVKELRSYISSQFKNKEDNSGELKLVWETIREVEKYAKSIPLGGQNFTSIFTNGGFVSSSSALNFKNGTNTTVLASQNGQTGNIDITVSSTGGGSSATSGHGAPAATPSALGAMYIDLDTSNIYIATGISSSADWRLIASY